MLESLFHFLRSLYDPEGLKELIRTGGAPLICGIVFVETGFFVGFFAFLALMVSPLFWARSSPRPESSPRAQMTSVERSVSVRYE